MPLMLSLALKLPMQDTNARQLILTVIKTLFGHVSPGTHLASPLRMGRGSAPQGGPGNYGGSKSAKPRKPRDVTHSLKAKRGPVEQPEEAMTDSTPAFTVTSPDPQRRAELLRAQKREKRVAAKLAAKAAALSRQPVNGTSCGGEVLGGSDLLVSVDSTNSLLREARLQHLAKLQDDSCASPSLQSSNMATSRPSTATVTHLGPVILSEKERLQAVEALLSQPIVESWQQRGSITDESHDDSDADINEDELHVLVVFLIDTLADSLAPADLAQRLCLLQTVLGNVAKEDPKYRKLRAGNDKLWTSLLQHPEFCMILESAGFQRSAEEQDRYVELGELELEVQELLTSNEQVDEARIDAMLHRMEELKQHPMSPVSSREAASRSTDLIGRNATFRHPANEALLGDLAVVLEAVAEWTPYDAEEAPQKQHSLQPAATPTASAPIDEA